MTTQQTVPVASLANLGAAFTEEATEVWCSRFQQEALTNYDGASYFCQFCGSTEHEALPAGSHVSETPSSVA